MAEDFTRAAQFAVAAASVGAFSRVMLALHGGVRRAGLLAIEAGVGASLGVMAAGAIAYWHPEIWDTGHSILVVAGGAGTAGALGNRLLDLAVAIIQKRLVKD